MHEKKEPELPHVNVAACQQISAVEAAVAIQQVEAAEMDERWSVVGKKAQHRW